MQAMVYDPLSLSSCDMVDVESNICYVTLA